MDRVMIQKTIMMHELHFSSWSMYGVCFYQYLLSDPFMLWKVSKHMMWFDLTGTAQI